MKTNSYKDYLGFSAVDTLPRLENAAGVQDYIKHLPKSIFVPVVGPDGEVDLQEHCEAGEGTTKETADKPPTSNNNGVPNGSYMQGLYGTEADGDLGRVRWTCEIF